MLRCLDHVNIRCADLAKSREFYAHTLGLTEGERPKIPVPGAWLYLGGRPVVHLIEAAAMGGNAVGVTGPFDHVAFEAEDFEGVRERLQARGVTFQESIFPDFGLKQLFFPDPDGVKIELNFPL